jgi:hypothetical protein
MTPRRSVARGEQADMSLNGPFALTLLSEWTASKISGGAPPQYRHIQSMRWL